MGGNTIDELLSRGESDTLSQQQDLLYQRSVADSIVQLPGASGEWSRRISMTIIVDVLERARSI